MDVANVQKIKFKYVVVWPARKSQKCGSKYVYFQIFNFLISCSRKYNVFEIGFCTFVGYIIGYIHDFFQIFLKLLNSVFEFFWTTNIPFCSGAPNLLSS